MSGEFSRNYMNPGFLAFKIALKNLSRNIAENNVSYFFLSAWAGKMNQILQSDWFRERAEFSDLDRGQRNGFE